MAKLKKSWQEKLNDVNDLPRVVPIDERMAKNYGRGTLVIAAPTEVDEIMREVTKGKVTTINEIRAALAKRHGATIACPFTTGIFAWIAANAAEESYAEGKKDITPWWRTLKSGGELNPKYPGGTAEQEARLKAEGHTIVPGKGKKMPKVQDYEKNLAAL